MSESIELRAMRAMAWERAKGELKSMLVTFYQNGDQFEAFEKEMDEFIEYVEDNALQE